MILDDKEVGLRLESEENLCNILVVKANQKGRPEGATDIPPLVKRLIGSIGAITSETQGEVANTFGTHQPTVSKLSRGLISDKLDVDLQDTVDRAKVRNEDSLKEKSDKAHELALDSLVASLESLTPKLGNITSPKELSSVATSMSKIAANIAASRRADVGVINNTQVVLYGVHQRKESYYETIEA